MPKDATTLYYVFSTLAQCAAALAALIGFLGLWRMDRLRDEENQVKQTIAEQTRVVSPFDDVSRLSNAFFLERARRIIREPQVFSDREQELQPHLEHWFERLNALPGEQQQLMEALALFLLGTLAILVVAIVVLVFADALYPCVWTMRGVSILAGLWLGIAPAYVVLQAAGSPQALRQHWSRRADQLQRLWTRARTWRVPAQLVNRLRASLTAIRDRRRRP